MSNEAAKRLRADLDGLGIEWPAMLDEALAAERKATVGLMLERLLQKGYVLTPEDVAQVAFEIVEDRDATPSDIRATLYPDAAR